MYVNAGHVHRFAERWKQNVHVCCNPAWLSAGLPSSRNPSRPRRSVSAGPAGISAGPTPGNMQKTFFLKILCQFDFDDDDVLVRMPPRNGGHAGEQGTMKAMLERMRAQKAAQEAEVDARDAAKKAEELQVVALAAAAQEATEQVSLSCRVDRCRAAACQLAPRLPASGSVHAQASPQPAAASNES